MAPLLYALAFVVPPLALLCCRRWWQAGVAWLVIEALVPAIPANWGLPGLLPVYVPVMLWALFAVDRRVAAGQAARRIHQAWGPPPAGGGP